MPKPHDRDPLDPDYHYVVTDDRGVRHDLGSLVIALVELHRDHPVSIEGAVNLPVDPHVVMAATEAGLEMGIKLAVRKLFGDAAGAAFSAHCDEVERFLQDSDTTLH